MRSIKNQRILYLLLAALAFSCTAWAQGPPPQSGDLVIVPSPPDYTRPAQSPDRPEARPVVSQPPVVLPQGTAVSIRFNRDLRLESPGSPFQAALAEDLALGGEAIAPRGTLVRGELVRAYNAQGRPELALSLTEIWLKNDWRSLHTEPLPVQARRGSGAGRKFLAGLALAGAIAGESLGGNRGCRRRSSATGLALRSASEVGAALLSRRGADLPQQRVKLKRGQQFQFQLLDALAFEDR